MEELLKLVQIVRQEIPQARVKVDSLMVTHYFTMEEILNICNKYAEYKCVLADVVGQSEQLPQKSEHCVSISPEPCKHKGVCKICS